MRLLSGVLSFVLLPLLWVICPPNAAAQTVVATVNAGGFGEAVAANPMTNKIYVADGGTGNATVIDGATNSTTTVAAGLNPRAVAVDEATNKIYVANVGNCTPFGNCNSPGSVTVIDGATNSTTTVTDPNANGPFAVAVNSVTNKIYVANLLSGNVTVIDGATNSTTTVTDPSAVRLSAYAVAVNQATNKIYVANNNLYGFSNTTTGNVTVIDGVTNATTTVTDPNAISPVAVAVNPVINKIYVANGGNYPGLNHGNVTVIDGATNSTTTIAIDPNALAPQAVAVNQATNKIYVANANDSALTGVGGLTIIDGTTNAISTVRDPNASFPHAVSVDSVTNTIYVANQGCFLDDPCINRGSTTVINGATDSVTTIIDPNATNPTGLALDPTTDRIYVAGGKVTVIDGGATPTTHILSLLLPGNGSGTVTSSPAGINCTMSCTASFAVGTAVDLTASPPSGATFSGWSTNCSGTGACNVTMSSDEFVTATFTQNAPVTLSVTKAGSGSGTVTSNPSGINCGSTCSATFGTGAIVQLTATADANSTFTGWSGPCAGTGACSVTMNAAESVTATFNSTLPDFSISPASASLTVQRGGQGTDAITIAPQNGSFGNPVQLTCAVSGPSPMPTCALSPTMVTPGANSATSMLTITAGSQVAAMLAPSRHELLGKSLFAVWLPLMLGITAVGGLKKHRRHYWALCGFLALLLLWQVACGGNSSSGNGTTPTNYTVTVTASSGAIQHTTQVAVIVQ